MAKPAPNVSNTQNSPAAEAQKAYGVKKAGKSKARVGAARASIAKQRSQLPNAGGY